MLGDISLWSGLGLCLWILLVPCGCGPHCSRESVRVLASLLGSSPSGVCHLSRVCSSVYGPVGVAHSIPHSFLAGSLSASAVGLVDALWLCPERAFCLFFALVSFVDPVRNVASLVPCLRWRFQSFSCGCSCGGASPRALGSVGAQGVRSGSTCIALHWTWSVSLVLLPAPWGSGRCFLLLPEGISAGFHGNCLFSLTKFYVSQPKMSHGVVLLGHFK